MTPTLAGNDAFDLRQIERHNDVGLFTTSGKFVGQLNLAACHLWHARIFEYAWLISSASNRVPCHLFLKTGMIFEITSFAALPFGFFAGISNFSINFLDVDIIANDSKAVLLFLTVAKHCGCCCAF